MGKISRNGLTVKAGWIFVLISLLFPFNANCQIEYEDEEDQISRDSLDRLPPATPQVMETLALSTFTFDDISQKKPYLDTLLHSRFCQYNPLYEGREPYLNLGNLGSSAIPLSQMLEPITGFNIGFHQFDVYKMRLDSFQWFRTNIPFADLYFGNGKDTPEFRVKAKFAKNFEKGWNLSLDYERIFEDGYYQNQGTKLTALTSGLWHRSANDRNHLFINFIRNVQQEENNGGIRDPIDFENSNYDIRSIMPVSLSKSLSRQQQNLFNVRHYYFPLEKKDSTGTRNPLSLSFVNQIAFDNSFYRFYDEDTETSQDSQYYGKLLVDNIGLRHYISYNKLSLSPSVSLAYKGNTDINIGLAYDIWRLNYEPLEVRTRQDLHLFGKARLTLFKNLDLRFSGSWHLGAFLGDLLLEAKGSYQFSRYIALYAGQKIIRSHPSLIQEEMYLTGRKVYQNDFDISTSTISSAGISIPVFGFSAGLTYRVLNKYIYYDPQLFFIQSPDLINHFTLNARQDISFKRFHFENSIYLYQTDADFLDLPLFYLTSKLYFHGEILKGKLLLESGFELFLQEGSFVPGYQAVTGSFYRQDEFETSLFPLLNFYAGFKVGSFRIYVRTENILSLITNDIYYQAKYYPQNDFKTFRVGIRWFFLN